MNCSICGRPLPPDGVCRNCYPAAPAQGPGAPASPLMPRKKLTSAAWFAPVAVLVMYFGWLIKAIINNFAVSKITQIVVEDGRVVYKNSVLTYIVQFSLNVVFTVLAILTCLLLYKLASNAWEKTLQKALKPMLFVPFVIWCIAKSGAGLFTAFLDKPMRLGRIPNILYYVLDYLIFFVMALIFGAVAFVVARSLLKLAEARNASPVRDTAVSPLRCKSAAWFMPVAVVLAVIQYFIMMLMNDVVSMSTNSLIKYDSSMSGYYSYKEIYDAASSLFWQFMIATCVVPALVLYLIAASKWGRQRRGAYRALAFVPYGLYVPFIHVQGIASGIVSALWQENKLNMSLQQYSTAMALSSLISPIVVGLIVAGISIPIAIGMMKKIQAHEDTITEKELHAAPVNAPAPGVNGAPAYAQPAYGPAPQIPPQAPAYGPAQPYPAQATAYDPAPSYSPVPPYPPQAPAYAPAPAQPAPVQPAPEAPAPDMPEA